MNFFEQLNVADRARVRSPQQYVACAEYLRDALTMPQMAGFFLRARRWKNAIHAMMMIKYLRRSGTAPRLFLG
jgi:ferritin